MDDNSFIEIRSQEEYRYKVSALLISSPTSSYLISVVAPCYLYCGALGDIRSSSDPTNLQGKFRCLLNLSGLFPHIYLLRGIRRLLRSLTFCFPFVVLQLEHRLKLLCKMHVAGLCFQKFWFSRSSRDPELQCSGCPVILMILVQKPMNIRIDEQNTCISEYTWWIIEWSRLSTDVFQFSSVAQLCPTPCGPMDCRMPGFPVHHQLLEPTQTHVQSHQWCHPTISSSAVPFSSCLQSFPGSGSSLRSWFFASGGQSIGVSASTSALPMNIQDWFPSGLTSLISLQSKRLSRIFSNTTIQKHQFFGSQLSL